MIWEIAIAITKDSSEKDRHQLAAIISLCREVYRGNRGAHNDVETSTSNASSCSNIDRKTEEVLRWTTRIQDDKDGQNSTSDHGRDHTVVPLETNRDETRTKVVTAW